MLTAQHLERLFSRVSSYAAFCFTPDGTVLTWNPGVKAIFGYSRDEFVGTPIAMLFTEDDRRAGIPRLEMRRAEQMGEVCDDRWHLRRDGVRLFVAGVVTPLCDESGALEGFVKLIRGRLEVVESSDQLRARGDRAEADRRETEAFVAVLSHELRQPLNAILGWATMGAHRRIPDGRLTDAFGRIVRSAESAVRLVNELLDVSRISAGKLELIVQPTNLATLVQETVTEMRADADSRYISLTTDIPAECLVAGDGERLRQVIGNLLGNAVKYTQPHGSIHVALKSGGAAVLTISDTGIGIPPADLPHIFDRFRQSMSATGRQSGLGLGLWLVREIVRRHQGTVTAESGGIGRGALFTVTLPSYDARGAFVAGAAAHRRHA